MFVRGKKEDALRDKGKKGRRERRETRNVSSE